jgi:two-component system, chemotaxis family, protein-glutamate methylesterase/glutaminase
MIQLRESDSFRVVVTASSAGGVAALTEILSHLPADFPAAVAVVQHRGASNTPGMLETILGGCTTLSVLEAVEGAWLRPGVVHVAPAGSHLVVNADGSLSLSHRPKVRYSRPAADRLFESAASTFGHRVIGVVLTGGNSDGSDGAIAVMGGGGFVIAQSPDTADVPSMPASAIATGAVGCVLALREIAPALLLLVGCVGSPGPKKD